MLAELDNIRARGSAPDAAAADRLAAAQADMEASRQAAASFQARWMEGNTPICGHSVLLAFDPRLVLPSQV